MNQSKTDKNAAPNFAAPGSVEEHGFVEEWLRNRGRVIAKSIQRTGHWLHFLTVLLTPIIAKPVHQKTLTIVFSGLFVGSLVFRALVNHYHKGIRFNLWLFNIIYVLAISYLAHTTKATAGIDGERALFISSGVMLVVFVFQIIYSPYHRPAIVVSTALVIWAIGVYTFADTTFSTSWNAIAALTILFATASQIVETRKNRTLAREYFQLIQKRVAAERQLSEAQEYASEAKALAVVATTQAVATKLKETLDQTSRFLEVFRSCAPEDRESVLHEFAQKFREQVSAADNLTKRILAAGSTPDLTWSDFNIEEVFSETLDEILANRPLANIKIEKNFAMDWLVRGDRQKIKQAVSAILSNAAEAMNWHGNLQIGADLHAAASHRACVIRITNSGPMIAPTDLPYIFDLFFTKNKKHGNGIGLAIAKRIITAHGGRIDVQSGDLTTFTIEIPVSSLKVNASSANSKKPLDFGEAAS